MRSRRPDPGRTPRRRRLLAVAAGAALALGASALGATLPAQAASGTTLTAAMDSSGIDTLNPFLSYFDGALNTFGLIYPTLNNLDQDGKPIPYLAKSWTTSPDQLTWTFTLESGLKWSDGQPLTAADAAWTLNLIMTNDVAGTANGSLVRNFASVTAPDATTLVIKTKKPQSNMLYVSVPVSGIPIVPQHVWESKVATLKTFKNDSFPVVGYGPWVLTNYAADQNETFDANKDFAVAGLKPPHYDHLILQVFKNSDAAVAALRSNQIASLENLNSTQFKALQSDSGLATYQTVGRGWTAIEVNSGAKTRSGKPLGTGNPILADPRVRSAINWSLDKDKLVSTVLGGLGQAGQGYLPPSWSQWAWQPAPADKVSYDPNKANAILDAAGYTKGPDGIRVDPKTGKKLSFRLGIHSDSSRDTQISQFAKGWLQAVGIDLQIQSLSMTKLNDDLAKGDWDMLMDSWGTGPDPTYLLSIQTCGTLPLDDGTGGNTDAFFCDKTFDSLFDQQVNTFDPAARAQIVGQMQDILYKANADIILYYANGLNALRKDAVTGLIGGNKNADGYYPVQSVFWEYLNAAPAPPASGGGSGTGSTSSSSSNTGLLVGIGVAVLAILGIGIGVARRRGSAGERE